MLEALISFLGGSAFRMIWGEVSAWFSKRQDHRNEVERMRLQADLEDRAHERNQAALRLQSELGIKLVEAKADAAALEADAAAFARAMENAWKPSGIFAIDAWNGAIRPAAATIVLALWILKLNSQGWVMSDWDVTLSGTVLGYFFADRTLGKRGR